MDKSDWWTLDAVIYFEGRVHGKCYFRYVSVGKRNVPPLDHITITIRSKTIEMTLTVALLGKAENVGSSTKGDSTPNGHKRKINKLTVVCFVSSARFV